jgi:nucleotide-binding universal stress UspA family protein
MLIVPAHGAPERIEAFEDKSKGYRCILVSLDGTPESEAILPLVETILAVKAATVVLMKTEPYVQFNTLKIGSDEYALINANAEMEARHYLEMIGDRLKAFGATPIVEVNFNNPQREIEVLSRYHEADLIAMATHGRTGLDRWLNRSITEGVLHSTQRPMLIVKMPAPQGTL